MRFFKVGSTEITVTPKTRRYINVRPGDDPVMPEADSFAYSIMTVASVVGLAILLASVVLIIVLGGWAFMALCAGMAAVGFLYIRYVEDPLDTKLEARRQRKLAKKDTHDQGRHSK